MLKSDQERNFKLGQDQQDDPVAKIAKINRKFEAEQAARQRKEIAAEIIRQGKAAKVKAARDTLLGLLLEGDHSEAVSDFTSDLTNADRQELIDSLKEDASADDEDKQQPLSPEAQKIVDDVMAKK